MGRTCCRAGGWVAREDCFEQTGCKYKSSLVAAPAAEETATTETDPCAACTKKYKTIVISFRGGTARMTTSAYVEYTEAIGTNRRLLRAFGHPLTEHVEQI